MMKKVWRVAWVVMICTAMLMAGCSSQSQREKPYDYDLSEYVKLGQYKGIPVQGMDIVVTEEEVQDKIQENIQQAGKEEVLTEGVVEYDDVADINFEGKKDGVAFEGGTANGYELTIGSGQFIPGFEEGLVGKAIGETVVLPLTFPEGYQSEDLAGQDVEFTVTVNSVTRTVSAVYDLAFVQENSEYETLEAYENALRAELMESKTEAAMSAKQGFVWQTIVDNSEILKVPEEDVNEFIASTTKMYQEYATMYQMEWEAFVQEQMGMTMEEYDTQLQEYARTQVEQEMIIFAIAAAEGITVSDEEYKDGITKYMEDQGYSSEKEYMDANGGISFEDAVGRKNIEVSLMAEKVLDFVTEEAVEEPKGE